MHGYMLVDLEGVWAGQGIRVVVAGQVLATCSTSLFRTAHALTLRQYCYGSRQSLAACSSSDKSLCMIKVNV